MAWADLEDRVTDAVISRFETVATYDGATSVSGVFDNGFYPVSVGDIVDIESAQTTFFCQLSDVSGIVHGKTFLINSVTYTTIGIEPDGEGAVLVRLEAP